jgi:hypothetical protein
MITSDTPGDHLSPAPRDHMSDGGGEGGGVDFGCGGAGAGAGTASQKSIAAKHMHALFSGGQQLGHTSPGV